MAFQNKESQIQYKIFNENDFIVLRPIHNNNQASYYLVIHRETLYIFLVKKLSKFYIEAKETKREIEFCEHYSHRCLTHFYGFIKVDDKVTGFVYEFMSNDSLDFYVKSYPDQIDQEFMYFTLIRIIQGINYLHSKSLIHRDIKPSNILLDHDFIPYISDFPTIRHIISGENKNSEEYTADIATQLYMSPEQYRNEFISFPTDIYSFGLIIYFLAEKKDMRTSYEYLSNDEKLPILCNISKNLQEIFESCVNFNPQKRIVKEELIRKLHNEMISNNHIFLDSSYERISILYENAFFNIWYLSSNDFPNNNDHFLYLAYRDINEEIYYLTLAAELNNPNAQYLLGEIFYKGDRIAQDINKAIYYFSLAAAQNHPDAQHDLGLIYYSGIHASKDIKKAIYYFTLAANQNEVLSQNNLGCIFYERKDINKSIIYLTLAAKQNHPTSQFILGKIYYEGIYIPRDISKSIYYLNLSANQNYAMAQFLLGFIYYEGKYVTCDINKSIDYLMLSANQNNSNSQFLLGIIYYEGKYISRDINKSINYLTLSAKQNDLKSQYQLGIIYYEGKYVSKDINKAIHYLKLSANQANKYAQYTLGYIYLTEQSVKNIITSLKYIQYSVENNCHDAQLLLGDLLFEGKYIKQDIEKAVHLYKEVSCFNNSHAIYPDFYLFAIKEKFFAKKVKFFIKI